MASFYEWSNKRKTDGSSFAQWSDQKQQEKAARSYVATAVPQSSDYLNLTGNISRIARETNPLMQLAEETVAPRTAPLDTRSNDYLGLINTAAKSAPKPVSALSTYQMPENPTGWDYVGRQQHELADVYRDNSRLGKTIAGGIESANAGYVNAAGTLADLAHQYNIGAQYSSTEDWRNAVRRAKTEPNATVDMLHDRADAIQRGAAENIEGAKEGLGWFGQLLVDAGVSGTQMIGDAAINTLIPGAGLTAMGVRSFGSAAADARREGADINQQMLYGLANAAVEVLSEKITDIPGIYGGGGLDDAIKSVVGRWKDNPVLYRVALAVASGMGESLEELAAGLLEPGLKSIYNGKGYFQDWKNGEWKNDAIDTLRAMGSAGILGAVGGLSPNAQVSEPASETSPVSTQGTAPASAPQPAPVNDALYRLAQEMADETVGAQPVNRTAVRAAAQPNIDAVRQFTETEQNAGRMSADGARIIRDYYDPTRGGAEDYIKAAAAAYNAGVSGADINSISSPVLTRSQRDAAYMAGQAATRQGQTEQAQTSVPARADTTVEEKPAEAQKKPVAAQKPGLNLDSVRASNAKLTRAEMRGLDAFGTMLGAEIRMVTDITDDNGKKSGCQGKYKDGVVQISVNAKDPYLTVAVHEVVHRIRALSPEAYDSLLSFVERNMKNADMERSEALRGLGYPEGTDLTEEVVADAFGTMLGDEKYLQQFVRDDRAAAQRLLDALYDLLVKVQRALSGGGAKLDAAQRAEFANLAGKIDVMSAKLSEALQMAAEAGQTEGDGTAKNSYAGTSARTADVKALETAQQMEETGADAETIRRETGWFRGADGKWRFEIDDNGMRYHRLADADQWKRDSAYRKYQDIKAKTVLNGREVKRGDATEEEFAYMQKYEHDHGSEPTESFANYYLATGRAKLKDILVHDPLFDAYPQLRDVHVEFGRLGNGVAGIYNPVTNRITVSETLRDAPEDVLIHEIQHAIQNTEGFSKGANPDYWRRKGYEGDAARSMYLNTAGEIEARDAASRRTLTPEQRRATRPNTGNNATVFVDDEDAGYFMSDLEQKRDDGQRELTDSQRKNYDYNQQQTEVGSTLRTLGQPGKSGSQIKRSKYGVGKDIGGTIYLHRDYVNDVIPAGVYESALQALQENYPDFQFNCVEYNPKDESVRFDAAPGFDTEREPVVGDYVRVNGDGTTKAGHTDYIWHHKWLWVKNDYQGFDVRNAWEWSKRWLSTISGKTYDVNGKSYNDRATSDGNGIERWNAQLKAYGLPLDSQGKYSMSTKEMLNRNGGRDSNGNEYEFTDMPKYQDYTSAGTSLPSNEPTVYKAVRSIGGWKPGTKNLDIGGGKTEFANQYLGEDSVENKILDPYNREADYNLEAIRSLIMDGKYDTVTCANVLNVINSAQSRRNVILEAAKALKPDGTVYFQIYEGDGKGGGKETSKGYQVNQKTAGYVDEIKQWFNDVEQYKYDTKTGKFYPSKSGNIIVASNPKADLPKAFWEYEEGKAVKYSKSTKDLLRQYAEQYGRIKPGENPARDVTIPKRTAPKTKVGQTIRTFAEAPATPESMIPTIEELVASHEFDFPVYGDEKAINNANSIIAKKGYNKALTDWTEAVKSGRVSKTNTALGLVLYNNAANSGDGKTGVDIMHLMAQHERAAGQAVQAMRILKKLSPEWQLYNLEMTVLDIEDELRQRYGDMVPDLKVDPDLAEMYRRAKTDDERSKIMGKLQKDIARQVPTTFMDRWTAWRYTAMLGNPRTIIRNVVGNAGFAPVVLTRDAISTAIQGALYRASGGKFSRNKANILGRGDLLAAAWKDYANVREEAMGESKYSDRVQAKREIKDKQKIFGNTRSAVWNKTGGAVLEGWRKGTNFLMDWTDVWFNQPQYVLAMAQYCAANGISAEQIKSGKGLDKAREYAMNEAQKATYRDTNDFSQMVSSLGKAWLRSENKWKKGVATLGEGIMPFRKTPANILARGVEYSPVGMLKSMTYDLYQVQKGNMGAAEMIDNLSAGLTGTGLLAPGAYLASQGLLRGRGGSDDKKKEFADLEGHQDYALELPNGKSITLDWLAPEALPVFIGANLWETASENRDELRLKDILSAIKNVSEPMLEMSMLQSLNELLNGTNYKKDGEINALMSKLSSAATSYLTQAFPTILGQAERTGEGKRMTTYTDKNDVLTSDMQYTLGKISAKVPIFDYHQIPYIDAWGREELTGGPVKRFFNNFVNPSYVSKVNESDMEKELERLYDATGEAVFPKRANKYVTVNGERKDLTGDEYVKYATVKGQTAYGLVGKIVETGAYKAMDDAGKARYIEDAYTYADQTAKTMFGAKIPDTYSWVAKAQTGQKQYGISPDVYMDAMYRCKDVESLKDKDGNTIQNSSGLQKMAEIYAIPGLTDAQRKYLFECMGVGKTIINYNKALVSQKLSQMRKQ